MRIVLPVIFILLTLQTIRLHAADTTYWVSTNPIGSGTSCADPSHNTPRTAVLTALAVAKTTALDESSGHTINICAGTYAETSAISINNDNLIGLTLQGVNASPIDAIIQGNATPTGVDVVIVQRAGVNVSNLELQLGDNALRIAGAGDRVTLDNIILDGSDNDCLQINGDEASITDIAIDGCAIRGIEVNITGAGTIDMTGVTVSNSGNAGIHLQNVEGGDIDDLIITNSATDGLSLRDTDNVEFSLSSLTENIISGSGDHGLEVDTESDNNTFLDFDILNTTDDGVNLSNSDNNVLTRINVINDTLPSDIPSNDGIVVNATSLGNTFNTVVVDNVVDECVAVSGDNTTFTGADVVIGDGLTVRNCDDFGIVVNTAAGSLLNLTSILTEDTLDDGVFIDNFTATASLGDATLTNVSVVNSGSVGITIRDSVNFRASNLTVQANNQGLNLANNIDIEVTDFSLSSVVADGILLNNTINSTISGNSALDRSTVTSAGNGNNDHGIQMQTGANGNTFEFIDLIDVEDDGINILDSLNNSFNDISISSPTVTTTEGVLVSLNSTGNSFNDISVDDVTQDCFETLADDTSLTTASFTNCGAAGVVVNLTTGTQLIIDEVSVTDPATLGISISNLDAAIAQNGDVSVTNITLTDATTGLLLSATSGGIYDDLDIQGSTAGIQLADADNNTFGQLGTVLLDTNATGLSLVTGSDSNNFDNLTITNNTVDGAVINASLSNTFDASDFSDNSGDGVRLEGTANLNVFTDNTFTNNSDEGAEILLGNSNSFISNEFETNTGSGIEVGGISASNIIDGNLFFENTVNGANLSGSGANSFYENCLRNSSNISDATGSTTYVNAGSGNFWGSIPAGTGFSETCTDAGSTTTVQTDDDICDAAYIDGGTTDASPLQTCDDYFTTHDMILSKTALTFNDPINGLESGGNNPKAIPGATIMYTVTATNQATTNRIGTAKDATITDDFDAQISGGTLSWNSNMVITSPDAGTSISLADPEDGDAGEFISNIMTAQCGDLNAAQNCTLTFTLEIQ